MILSKVSKVNYETLRAMKELKNTILNTCFFSIKDFISKIFNFCNYNIFYIFFQSLDKKLIKIRQNNVVL